MPIKQPEQDEHKPFDARLSTLESGLEELKAALAKLTSQEYQNSAAIYEEVKKMLPSESIAADLKRIADSLECSVKDAEPATQTPIPFQTPPPPPPPPEPPQPRRGIWRRRT